MNKAALWTIGVTVGMIGLSIAMWRYLYPPLAKGVPEVSAYVEPLSNEIRRSSARMVWDELDGAWTSGKIVTDLEPHLFGLEAVLISLTERTTVGDYAEVIALLEELGIERYPNGWVWEQTLSRKNH